VNPSTAIRKLKVLLIEDNAGDARLIREYLSDEAGADFSVEHVPLLAAGLERLAAGGIDLVLLDLSLPDSPMPDTFRRVHQTAPQVPIIVMSGLDDEEFAIQTVQEGAQDYLVKNQVETRLLVHAMRYAIERKRVAEAFEHERELFHTLMDSIPDRVFFKDTESRFTRINRALASHFRIDHPRDATGRTDADFFAAEHAGTALEDEQRVMRSGEPILGKIERETLPDGSVAWALTSKLPLKNSRGQVTGSFGISRDITELKQSEEALQGANTELARHKGELQKTLGDLQRSHEDLKAAQFQLIQAEKMQSVGRLAAGVAHEVKNPLGILRMGVDYLSQHLQSSDENVALVLSDMSEAIKRADGIILGLLDFSAPHALDTHADDLSAVIEQSLALVRHEIKESNVTLIKELAPGLPPVWLDRNKMKQVFVNLFTNACHAMPRGGTLTIRTSSRKLTETETSHDAGSRHADRFHSGETVVIAEIIDNGTGIPAEKLAHIFDPFYTTKETGKGTGLGLTVTKKIVELHGGTIEIRNRKEGGASATLMFRV
jgi:PAS domain S-box-containing protein